MSRSPVSAFARTTVGVLAVLALGSSAVPSAVAEQPRQGHQQPAPTPEVVASSPGLTPVPTPSLAPNATPLDQLSPGEQAWSPYQPMGSTLSAIEADHADTFSYAYFDGFTGVIGFSGEAPTEAIDALAATGLPYEVHAHVGYTYAEHRAEADRVSEKLLTTLDLGDSESSVVVGPSPVLGAGRIVVTVASQNPETLQRMQELAKGLKARWPFSIVVETSDDPVVLLQSRR